MTAIYVIGDSFSAGAELDDHTFESYKKYNPKDVNEYIKWIDSKEYQNELKSRIGYNKFYAELKRSWPSKLASMTNSTVINKSFGGSGPSMWRGKVALDFLDFSKFNTTIDIAIIQITDYNRTCLFSHNPADVINYINLGSYQGSFGKAEEKMFLKARAMIQDDVGDFFNFLLDLANIKMTLLYHGVKTIKFVGSCHNNTKIINDNNYASYINEINSILEFLDTDFDKIPHMSKHTKSRLPGGHFDELTHAKFALAVKEILKL